MTAEKLQWEKQCYGLTEDQVEAEFRNYLYPGDEVKVSRLMFAMSILSDAQETLARGNDEQARQWINKAKYHIGNVRRELVHASEPVDERTYVCPDCAGTISVDEEYMVTTYGSAWEHMPGNEITYYCNDEDGCGWAGTIE